MSKFHARITRPACPGLDRTALPLIVVVIDTVSAVPATAGPSLRDVAPEHRLHATLPARCRRQRAAQPDLDFQAPEFGRHPTHRPDDPVITNRQQLHVGCARLDLATAATSPATEGQQQQTRRHPTRNPTRVISLIPEPRFRRRTPAESNGRIHAAKSNPCALGQRLFQRPTSSSFGRIARLDSTRPLPDSVLHV